MESLLLFLGGGIFGGILVEHYVKMTMKKLHKTDMDNAYHSGFEQGVEKGRNDYEAELRAFAQATQQEENDFAKRMEGLGYSISLEATDHQHSESCEHATETNPYLISPFGPHKDVSSDSAKKSKKGSKKRKSPKKKAKTRRG